MCLCPPSSSHIKEMMESEKSVNDSLEQVLVKLPDAQIGSFWELSQYNGFYE